MEKVEYNKLRAEAAKWLNGKRDFLKGCDILERAKFRPSVIAVLRKHGANGPSSAERLEYHMQSFIKLWYDKTLSEDTDTQLGVVHGEKVASEDDNVSILSDAMTQKMQEMPEPIGKVIKQYRDAYVARDKCFKQLKELPEDNTDATVAKRHKLSDEMERLTDEMDRLYPVYKRYLDTGEVTDPEPEPEPAEKHRVNIEAGLQHVDKLSKNELRKLRKCLTSKLSRAQNMLLYQTETKQEEPNPVTDELLKLKYNSKIKRLEEELHKVREAYARLS